MAWFARQGTQPDLDKRMLLDALRALRRGDFEVSLPPGFASADGEIVATFNDVVQLARSLQDELRDVRVAIGKEGRSTRRLRDSGLRGGWAACAWAVNELLDDVLAGTPRGGSGGGQGSRCERPTSERFDAAVELLAGVLGVAHGPAHDRPPLRAPRLHSQPEERAGANQRLERELGELAERNAELERKLDELRAAHARLAEDADRHRDASARKSRFVAALSHELRAPIHNLLLLSHKLARGAEGALPPPLSQYIEALGQTGGDLLSLVDDLVDVTQLESGTFGVQPALVSIAELAQYAERSFQPPAASRQLSFRVSVDPELPAAFETDARRVKQVLRNLLENAFKFTEHGGVRLSIFRNERAGSVAFAVSDTGIGIAQADQQAIFEPFRQLAAPVTRDDPGTGLGLSISREIASALGGSLHVSSVAGRGSTFTLELPLGPPARDVPNPAQLEPAARPREGGGEALRPQRAPERAAAVEPALVNRRVRVLNGDVRDVFAVTAALEPHAVRVLYGDGDATDAVLVYVEHPAASGHDTLQRVRARHPQSMLIAMTPRSERNARELCIAAGADACIGKPLAPAELLAALKVWFAASPP